jgi:hypothetical protein
LLSSKQVVRFLHRLGQKLTQIEDMNAWLRNKVGWSLVVVGTLTTAGGVVTVLWQCVGWLLTGVWSDVGMRNLWEGVGVGVIGVCTANLGVWLKK